MFFIILFRSELLTLQRLNDGDIEKHSASRNRKDHITFPSAARTKTHSKNDG